MIFCKNKHSNFAEKLKPMKFEQITSFYIDFSAVFTIISAVLQERFFDKWG